MTKYCKDMCIICFAPKIYDSQGLYAPSEENAHETCVSEIGSIFQDLIQVSLSFDEERPQFVCNYCKTNLITLHKFKLKAEDAYKKVSNEIHNAELTECSSIEHPLIVEEITVFDVSTKRTEKYEIQYLDEDQEDNVEVIDVDNDFYATDAHSNGSNRDQSNISSNKRPTPASLEEKCQLCSKLYIKNMKNCHNTGELAHIPVLTLLERRLSDPTEMTTKPEDDLECIYKENNGEKVLTDLGRIYQDVLNIMVSPDHTPQYFCTFCTLQLRLFQKFKKKALESYNLFIKSVCEEEYISKCNDDDDIKEKVVIMDLEIEKDDESSQDENFVGFVDSDEFEEVQYLEEFVTVNVDLAGVDTYDEYSNIENSDSNLQENKKSKLKNKKNNRGKMTKGDIDHEEQSSQVIESLRKYRSSSNQSLSDADDYSGQSDNDIDEDSLEKTKNKPKSKDKVKTKQFENYPCKNCDKVFHTKYSMDAHRKKYHPRTRYPCHLCHKIFFSEESLQVHINVHNGLPAYKCEECKKTFKHKVHFVYHMMGHRNERNVQCHLCGKGFLNNSDLRIHLRVHNDERRYECDVCGKRFRAHTHMTDHRYSHFEQRLECEMCLQTYSSPNTLRTHIKAVHKGECPYECETCSRKFKRKHHLKAHYRIHQRNRIYIKSETQSSESITEWTLE